MIYLKNNVLSLLHSKLYTNNMFNFGDNKNFQPMSSLFRNILFLFSFKKTNYQQYNIKQKVQELYLFCIHKQIILTLIGQVHFILIRLKLAGASRCQVCLFSLSAQNFKNLNVCLAMRIQRYILIKHNINHSMQSHPSELMVY